MIRTRSWALLALFLLTAGAAQATEKYSGYIAPNTSVFPRTGGQRLMVTIDSFTDQKETEFLVDTVQKKGVKALEKELWKREIGRISVGNSLSYPIATAHSFEDPELGTRKLILLLARPISYGEIARSSRSVQYPFTLVELDTDGAGNGSGEMLVAAKISVRRDGSVEIENLDARPLRILKVQRSQ